MTISITSVIELFLRSTTLDVAPTDLETLGHACAGPGAQMKAASATRSLRVFLEENRQALDQVTELAGALQEELVVWDTSTLKGRRAARKRGVRRTPAVVFGLGKSKSVADFVREAQMALQMRRGAHA